ncbi:MAG TPA: putative quinol monooxygenase [Bryobacteraceae bacterium]|jgi:quinol monooxygenase YgiN|nr:putative quinol monooxygenase [Bryobacteraceae bacterium]
MRRILAAARIAGFAWISLIAVPNLAAQAGRSFYAVTHVDVIGSGGNLAEAVRLVREFVADSRQDAGVIRFEALQQEGHANHFTIFEVWQSRQAFEAHSAAEHTKRFRQALQPMLGSPFRERLHNLVP